MAKTAVRTFKGYTPLPHQAAVHKALNSGYKSGKIYVVKSRRQCGKSALVEQELLRYSINYPATVSAIVSPTLAQARKVFKDIYNGIVASGIIQNANSQLLEMSLINGSQLLFKSAEQKESLRGYTISGILCIDECAFIPDDVYYIIQPWVNVHKAPILMTSTPRFKTGFFYDTWLMGLDENTTDVEAFDFNDYDTTRLLSAEKLEQYRLILPKLQYKTEYLGEFLDGDSMLFADFKSCIYVGSPTEYGRVYIGIDWGSGSGKDSTAISVLNEHKEQVYCYHFNDKNTSETVNFIHELWKSLQAYNPYVLAEVNSIGKPYCDLLKEKGIKVNEFVTSNSSKAELVAKLSVAFENRQIKILGDDEQTKQISMYEATYNAKTGNVSYNAPVGASFHDDCVIALMLSLEALNKSTTQGNYVIGFSGAGYSKRKYRYG